MRRDDSLDLRNVGGVKTPPLHYSMDHGNGIFGSTFQLGMELETLGIGTRHDAGSLFT